MRVFKTIWFTHFARKEEIADADLLNIAKEYDAGNYGINLGGSVFKHRVARKGGGKSGGFRVIIFFRKGERLFFVYGFAKSKKENLDEHELATFKKSAKSLLNMPENILENESLKNRFIEIFGENR